MVTNVKEQSASRTAEYMALFRALESSRRPSRIRLFDDPFAYLFLQRALRGVVELSRTPLLGVAVPRLIDLRWPGARSSGIARTRLIDDYVRASLRESVDQVIILGAGFDCRAYRIAEIGTTRVFEVDHPATLSKKKEGIKHIFGALPKHVAYVDVDFNTQSLGRALHDSGFNAAERSFFIWEGVTNYLTEQAVDSTLNYVGGTPGSRIVFTYVHRGVLDGSATFGGTRHVRNTLQRAGETWTFGLYPERLQAYLAERGLDLMEDVGASEYRARYMGASAYSMKGYEFYRVAFARSW
jgi:methyltransferase (TIGR00027 family)